MIVGLLILCRNSMKGSKITHMWADFSLKTGLSGFTSVSLIREREGGGGLLEVKRGTHHQRG